MTIYYFGILPRNERSSMSLYLHNDANNKERNIDLFYTKDEVAPITFKNVNSFFMDGYDQLDAPEYPCDVVFVFGGKGLFINVFPLNKNCKSFTITSGIKDNFVINSESWFNGTDEKH